MQTQTGARKKKARNIWTKKHIIQYNLYNKLIEFKTRYLQRHKT